MKNSKKILTIIFGVMMIAGGVVHFINPEMNAPFFPEYFPAALIIYATGAIEIVVGIFTLISRYTSIKLSM